MNTNRTEIEFDTKFFQKDQVMMAAQEYTTPFWVFVDGSDEKINVVLVPKEGEIDQKTVRDEFYNFVLSVGKNY